MASLKQNAKRFLVEDVIPREHKLIEDERSTDSMIGLAVEAVSLLKIMEEINVTKNDFLELDCEGAEGEIIKSFDTSGFIKIKKVTIEFHDNNSILKHSEIIDTLESNQFETKLVWDGNLYFGYIYGVRLEN